MQLIEYEGKALLRERGLPVPRGSLVAGDAITRIPAGLPVLKAQVPAGGRGKAGLVRIVGEDADAAATAEAIAAAMRELGWEPLLLAEERIEHERECYLAWRIDDVLQAPVLMFSIDGGVDVERSAGSIRELACTTPGPVLPHQLVPFFIGLGLRGRAVGALARFAAGAWRVFRDNDCELLEINPLAITARGEVSALDAKVALDDSAAVRHAQWRGLVSHRLQTRSMTALERRAAESNITFVELDGRVALVTGGAGLGMALVDLLGDAGLGAANFLDASGGSGVETFAQLAMLGFERALDPRVESILAFFTLSATSLRSVVAALLELLDRAPPPKPLVLGFVASGAAEREMTVAQAIDEFARRGHRCVDNVGDAIAAIGRLHDSPTLALDRARSR